ncbi:MAG TPA: hypothetical protein VFW98_16705 [Gemmatimonadaceae bacterium]|nr:hypothetical protein [Gemmatimonadaceae bacterium]
MDALAGILRPLLGRPVTLSSALLDRYPELRLARVRRGGLPVRVGGWMLGRRTAAAITLWHTVFLAPREPAAVELLLHELRHIHQFQESATFPVQYLWESLRRGYHHNRFEADARRYATARLRESGPELRRGEG